MGAKQQKYQVNLLTRLLCWKVVKISNDSLNSSKHCSSEPTQQHNHIAFLNHLQINLPQQSLLNVVHLRSRFLQNTLDVIKSFIPNYYSLSMFFYHITY